MKKLAAIAVVAAIVAATSFADTTNILGNLDITIKGKLSPSGIAITGNDLSGNTNAISYLLLDIISEATTQEVIGVGQVTVAGDATNVVMFLSEKAGVDLTPTAPSSSKFVSALSGTAGSASNAVILLSGTLKLDAATNATLKAKISGIWADGAQAVAGSMASVKRK